LDPGCRDSCSETLYHRGPSRLRDAILDVNYALGTFLRDSAAQTLVSALCIMDPENFIQISPSTTVDGHTYASERSGMTPLASHYALRCRWWISAGNIIDGQA